MPAGTNNPTPFRGPADPYELNDTSFATNAGGAAFGNPNLTQQGINSRAAQISSTQDNKAPAKAPDAPTAGKENIFTGLCEALNKHQQDLVKSKKRKIADQYSIEFAPNTVGGSTVKRPLDQDATTSPMQNNNTASKLDSKTNKLNRTARTYPIRAGSQIVQVIDNVMRNSSFITGQQNIEISTAVDPVTGIQTQKLSAKAGTGNFQWFKITLNAKWLGYDTEIRDHAYQFTFIVTPYAVGQMISQYFPDSTYRGVHKSYQYWFTGQNTQVISYEAEYNNLYSIVLTGTGPIFQNAQNADFRDLNRKIYMATSENRAAGAKDYANEPGDNAASYFYDPDSLKVAKLRIVGDPAWLQQGEVGLGVSAKTFNFNPFNPDGAINYDASAIFFDISFNHPVDYNFNTGIMDVNAGNQSNLPIEHYTYYARSVKSFFRKGRFEQEIEGPLVTEKKTSPPKAAARPTATIPSAANTRQAQAQAQDLENGANAGTGTGSTIPDDGSKGYAIQDETGQTSNLRKNEYGDLYYPPELQPAAPPKPATSSGPLLDLSYDLTKPVTVGGVNLTTPLTLNPNATGQTLVAQPGVNTPPQKMNKEE